MTTNAIKALKEVWSADTIETFKNAVAKFFRTKAANDSAKAAKNEADAMRDSTNETKKNTKEEILNDGQKFVSSDGNEYTYRVKNGKGYRSVKSSTGTKGTHYNWIDNDLTPEDIAKYNLDKNGI
jgi:mRNA-degrading endonuclease RelE of RelBE toxin-antitoxin system